MGPLTSVRASSREDPDTVYELTFSLENKPFPMTFAQLLPHGSTIGAFEYIDEEVDRYFESRWPVCLAARGNVSVPCAVASLSEDDLADILLFARVLLWEIPGEQPNPDIPPDQRATRLGYRRQFLHSQMLDIVGNRRHRNVAYFSETELGDPIGPGVITLDLPFSDTQPNELVWSPILRMENRRDRDLDMPRILAAIDAIKRHYNSYTELGDARRLLGAGEVRASIRSAASSVDASLLYLRQANSIAAPPRGLMFDEKVEHALRSAGLPSYTELEPAKARLLLYLYRARNSMHEGDCYYIDLNGQRNVIRGPQDAQPLIDAAGEFVLWVDSLV